MTLLVLAMIVSSMGWAEPEASEAEDSAAEASQPAPTELSVSGEDVPFPLEPPAVEASTTELSVSSESPETTSLVAPEAAVSAPIATPEPTSLEPPAVEAAADPVPPDSFQPAPLDPAALALYQQSVKTSRRWRTGRVLARTGVSGMVAGPPLLVVGTIMAFSPVTASVGIPMSIVGGIFTVYGVSALPIGLAKQNRAMRQAGLQTTPVFLTVAAAGAGVAVLGVGRQILAVAGTGMIIGGLVMQHMENRRVLRGDPSMWSAGLQPWSDGQHHGLRLVASW